MRGYLLIASVRKKRNRRGSLGSNMLAPASLPMSHEKPSRSCGKCTVPCVCERGLWKTHALGQVIEGIYLIPPTSCFPWIRVTPLRFQLCHLAPSMASWAARFKVLLRDFLFRSRVDKDTRTMWPTKYP